MSWSGAAPPRLWSRCASAPAWGRRPSSRECDIRSMPKIESAKIPAQPIASYPKEFAPVISGREKQRIGDAVGLTQFGVNITRIKPHSAAALRHVHENEDEFIYVLEGELILHENDGETVLKPGDAAGFKAGSGIAHCLINRTDRDAVYFEVGT